MRKSSEVDQENYYKEAFRVFFKDDTGCIPADELKFILRSLNVSQFTFKNVRHSPYHPYTLPLQIKPAEIERMIRTVDKNGDGKISYSEFRVMLGAMPLVLD